MLPTYTKEDYAKAYTEVLGMLKYFSYESIEKIPKDVMQMYEENKDKNYEFEFDRDKSFENQDISKLSKILIANIFTDYIATEEERKYLNFRDKQELENLEKEKRDLYNPDNIFEKRKKTTIQEATDNNEQESNEEYRENHNTSLIITNENEGIIKRILKIIRNLFKKD